MHSHGNYSFAMLGFGPPLRAKSYSMKTKLSQIRVWCFQLTYIEVTENIKIYWKKHNNKFIYRSELKRRK